MNTSNRACRNSIGRIVFAAAFSVVSFAAIVVNAAGPQTKPAVIPIVDVKDHPVDFAEEILPIFRTNCLACHNAKVSKASLILESPKSIRTGGDSGPSVSPADPMQSLLLSSAAHLDKPYMPPANNKVGAKPLTSEELGLIRLWIKQGAKGDETIKVAPIAWQALPDGLNPIIAVAISPDGQFVACGRANQIFIYDLPGKRLVTRLTDPSLLSPTTGKLPGTAHRDLVQSLAFSPDGRTLASGGYRDVKFWQRPEPTVRLNIVDAQVKAVNAVASSPDGRLIAAAGDDHLIRLYQLPSGKPAGELKGNSGPIVALRFAADATRLYSASADRSIRLWDTAAALEIAHVEAPTPPTALAVLGNGQFVTASSDNALRIWPALHAPDRDAPATAPTTAPVPGAATDPKLALPFRVVAASTTAIASLAANPAVPTQFVSSGADGAVKLWDAATGSLVRQWDLGGAVTAVAFRADGKRVAAGGAVKYSRIFSLEDGRDAVTVRADREALQPMHEAERKLAYATGEADHWQSELADANRRKESETDSIARVNRARTRATKALADTTKANDAKTAAKAEADKALADANAAAEAAKVKKDAAASAAADVKAAADSALAVATVHQHEADARQREILRQFVEASSAFERAQQTMESLMKALTSGQTNLAKAIADIESAKSSQKSAAATVAGAQAALETARKAVEEAGSPAATLAFTSDGGTLVTAGLDAAVRTWSTETGAPVETLHGHAAPVLAVASGNEGAILSASADGSIKVWDTTGGWKLARTLGAPDGDSPLAGRVECVAFSPDGSVLATGSGVPSRNGELKIWKTGDGSLVREIKDAHSDSVMGLSFSRDGRLLASSSADKFMKVFAVADGSLVHTFEGHASHVLSVDFRYDGRMLVTGGADNQFKSWDLIDGEEQKLNGLAPFPLEVTSVHYVGYSDTVLLTTGDGVARLIKDTGSTLRELATGDKSYLNTSAATPDGTVAVAGGENGILHVWDPRDGKVLATFAP